MKRTIEASLSGVISTGSFQNFRPGFSDTLVIDDCTMDDEEVTVRRKQLFDNIFRQFKEVETMAIMERIAREHENIRIYPHPNGSSVPSVTSVRDWDIDMWVTPEDLNQYASQSNIVHAKVAHFIDTKKWVVAKEIDDVWPDIVICTKGHLKLPVNTGDFPAFLDKFPISDMVNGVPVFLEDSGGLPDFYGIPDFTGAEKIDTVFDCKRTPDKVKDGIQLSAYCKAKGFEQGIIVPLNGKTTQGYSKPIVYDKKQLAGYFKIYQQKREHFRKRFGL